MNPGDPTRRILFVSDAWRPQINGVVTTLAATAAALSRREHAVEVIGPDRFRTMPMPFYPEIGLAWPARDRLARLIRQFAPDAIHIATEGPLGWAARGWCLRNGRPFTTSYNTRFPEYLAARRVMPACVGYAILRWFHAPSRAVLAPSAGAARLLKRRGFRRVGVWPRGVDLDLFRSTGNAFGGLPRPLMACAGRLAVEKNVEAFLALPLPGTKLVIGDGPARRRLQRRYPGAVFAGCLVGEALAAAYSAADVLVFPSRTDTFGLVMAEALACGTPIAAYPVPGPLDVLTTQSETAPVGVMHGDLAHAVRSVLARNIPPGSCRDYATRHFSWAGATDMFLAQIDGLPAT